MFICVHDVSYVRYSLIIQNFATSKVREKWSKTEKFIGAFFSINLTKKYKERGEILFTFAGTKSLTLNLKLCKVITTRNLTKMPQKVCTKLFLHKIHKYML